MVLEGRGHEEAEGPTARVPTPPIEPNSMYDPGGEIHGRLTQGEATDRETQTAISGRRSAGGLEPARNQRRREDARRVEETFLQLATPRRRGAEKISTLPAHAGAT